MDKKPGTTGMRDMGRCRQRLLQSIICLSCAELHISSLCRRMEDLNLCISIKECFSKECLITLGANIMFNCFDARMKRRIISSCFSCCKMEYHKRLMGIITPHSFQISKIFNYFSDFDNQHQQWCINPSTNDSFSLTMLCF